MLSAAAAAATFLGVRRVICCVASARGVCWGGKKTGWCGWTALPLCVVCVVVVAYPLQHVQSAE
jgi:hypothetical protein